MGALSPTTQFLITDTWPTEEIRAAEMAHLGREALSRGSTKEEAQKLPEAAATCGSEHRRVSLQECSNAGISEQRAADNYTTANRHFPAA